MEVEWRRATVAELQVEGSLLVEDGNHGEYRPRPDEFVNVGIAFIRAADMNAGRVFFESASKVNERARQRITKGIGHRGDVLLSHKGTVGKVALVGDDAPLFVCSPQTTLWRALDPEVLDRRYLYAYLRSPEFHAQLAARAGETDMAPYVSLTSQRGLSVALPPIDSQRAIGHILGTLDDKIELNRQMNETLEVMAQALFKSWFVESTQNGLPKGWSAGTLGDVAGNMRRTVGPRHIDPSTPYIGLEHMPRRCLALGEWGNSEELESNKFAFKCGEILFGKLRPYFHKVGVAPIDGVCSTDILVIGAKEPEWFGFVLGHISSVDLVNHTDAGSTGTKMPRTNWQDIARFEVALPPRSLAAAFTKKIRPLNDRIIANIHESRTLAAIRDALLPKLLTGEIRVGEPVEFSEEAVNA